MRYQKILQNMTLMFTLLLVVLIFFSQTLMDMHSARVSLGFIEAGIITQEVSVMGTVRPANEVRIDVPGTGVVTWVIEPGALVSAGTVLLEVSADVHDVYTRLVTAQERVQIIDKNRVLTQELWEEAYNSNDYNEMTRLDYRMRALYIEQVYLDAELIALMRLIDAAGIFIVQAEGTQRIDRVFVDLGAYVIATAPAMAAAVVDGQFMVEAYFPQTANFLRVMNSVAIQASEGSLLLGTIHHVAPHGNQNRVRVAINSYELQGGEIVMLTASDAIQRDSYVIPSAALRRDMIGYYVLYVESEPRRIGQAYVLRVFRVVVRRRDNWNVSIAPAFIGREDIPDNPIVVNSNRPIRVGNRVRLT